MTSKSTGKIQDDNSTIGNLSSMLELARMMPVGSEPRELAELLSELPTLPDRFNTAFLKHGWIFVEFACGHEHAEQALKMLAQGNEQSEIDSFLATNLLSFDPIKWQAIRIFGGGMSEPTNPIRAHFTERIFQAYEAEDYLVAVPLIFMLIDGFSISVSGTKSIFSDLDNLDDLFQSVESVAGHPSALKSLLPYLIRGQKGYKESALTLPLRNGILHGVRLNYANKIVAAKALCLLAAVVEWGRDVAPEPSRELKKRTWNADFLSDNLARLNASTPEQALNLFTAALETKRFTDVVALIDYHPTITLLSEKITEWRELSDMEILIERRSEWTVFGTTNDSEQQARCEIKLRVKPKDGNETSVDRTLFAKRSVELAKAGLPSVWQIGLSILGAIRHQMSMPSA